MAVSPNIPAMPKQLVFKRNSIAYYRKRAGMKARELAELADVSAAHLSNLENGKRGYSDGSLDRIAAVLKKTKGELLAAPPLGSDDIPEPEDSGKAELDSLWNAASGQERETILTLANALVKKLGK